MGSHSAEKQVVNFYRFVPLPDLTAVRARIKELGLAHGILGSVLLAPEGINGTVSGEHESLQSFFTELGEDLRFRQLQTRVSYSETMPFRKYKVRLKKEIVTLKSSDGDPSQGVGDYVSPDEWNQLIEDPEVVVIDVRNRYETALGTFQGAIDPSTDHFSDFPKFVEGHLTRKDQTIATFCTGGIRCEKATAYLKQQGFLNVKHLRGGILSYLEQIPRESSLWEGSCFVFDDREALDDNLQSVRTESADPYGRWTRRGETDCG